MNHSPSIEKGIDRRDAVILALCYGLWGFLPLYWALMPEIDALFLLAFRVFWSAAIAVSILAVRGRMEELAKVFRNRKLMRWLIPASIFMLGDWSLFIVAIQAGRVLDVSLAYYLTPLLAFFWGVVLFRERSGVRQFVALGLAAAGVVISAVGFQSFPWFALVIAFNWSMYGVMKKNADLDAAVSFSVETLLITPLAIAFVLLFRRGGNGFGGMSWTQFLFLFGGGVFTAVPMLMYSRCVTRMPLVAVAFFQYLSPTFNILAGLLLGETITTAKWVSFAFIWAGILVFTSAAFSKKPKDTAALPERQNFG